MNLEKEERGEGSAVMLEKMKISVSVEVLMIWKYGDYGRSGTHVLFSYVDAKILSKCRIVTSRGWKRRREEE